MNVKYFHKAVLFGIFACLSGVAEILARSRDYLVLASLDGIFFVVSFAAFSLYSLAYLTSED